jgi:DNA-binding MarR family transcriptional regulator
MHSATVGGVAQWLTSEQQQAWRGLLAMTSQLGARLNQQLQADGGLSLSDYDVLVPLSEAADGRLRVYELTERLGWEQSRLSHHLTRMQRRGLVVKEECRTDRRGAVVVLTEEGRRAIERAAPAHVDAVRRLVFAGASPEQVAALTDLTARVLARLAEPPPSGAGS